jgi:hypothetical protein
MYHEHHVYQRTSKNIVFYSMDDKYLIWIKNVIFHAMILTLKKPESISRAFHNFKEAIVKVIFIKIS